MKVMKLRLWKEVMNMVKIKFFLIIFLSCFMFCKSSLNRQDTIAELTNNFKRNQPFFLSLEDGFSINTDSLNTHYNSTVVLNELEVKTGIFFMNLDFLHDKKSNKIYIGTGTNDCSGYLYFSETKELECMISYLETLQQENKSIEISIRKLTGNWVAYNKNQEASLDVVFYNKMPDSQRCFDL